MKILKTNDYEYYFYPEGISNLDEFISYANEHYHSFVKLMGIEAENCVFPYFIREDITEAYVNIARIWRLEEVDVTVLDRAEYEARLAKVVQEKCINCVHYTEDLEGDNLRGHRDKITLDGKCWAYEEKK